MNFTLSTASWDDQGLWFALLFNFVVGICLFAASAFLLLAPVLWLRRLYRTNQTVLRQSASRDPKSLANRSAAKRVAFALDLRCSLFALPSWRDWLSVEERVPHLESALCPAAAPAAVPSSRGPPGGGRGGGGGRGAGGGGGSEGEAQAPAGKPPSGSCAPPRRPRGASKKAPLDPQVALYLSFLKLAATVGVIGGFFTIWICALSGTDNYMERYMVERDIHHCYAEQANETQCVAKAPHCRYIAEIGCFPVPMRGLDDLSAQNIAPRSWRLWFVGLFEMCFCVVYTVCVLFFLRRVDAYIAGVMYQQMDRSLGHRVVIVRGLRNEETISPEVFKERFLSESNYFRPRQPHSGTNVAHRNQYSDSDGVDDDKYYQYDCTGIGCIFSVVRFHRYTTTRANAIFTRECNLEQLLFVRDPPHHIYSYMDKTEKVMGALEEALADEKKHQQDLEEKHKFGSTNHESKNKHGNVLMMRRPFPSCCGKVPKVDYYKAAFREQAMRLNKSIDEIGYRQSKGSAFIVFRNSLAAYEFVNLFESRYGISSNRRATLAGPPGQIVQINVSANRYADWLRTLAVTLVFVLLLFFWSIPVGFLGSLDNIARVPGIGEAFKKYYSHVPEAMRGILTAFLPVLVLALFNIALPYIVQGFVIAMGAVNYTERDGGSLYLQYLFMLLTGVIFQAALQGGLAQLGDLIADMSGDSIINFFVAVVSPSGGYWYAKILSAACLSTWIELIDFLPLFMAIFRRKLVSVQRVYDTLFQPCRFLWTQRYSADLTILAMGLLFRMTAPLMTLFVGLYFVMCYMTQRCRLYDRYQSNISPEENCTNFAASVQVLRAVSWLYCLGGIGNVLFMTLRDHTGGVVCCSITLAVGILLLVYVHIHTRRWVASLEHARKFFGNRADSPTVYGTNFNSPREAPEAPSPQGTFFLEKPLMETAQTQNADAESQPMSVFPSTALLPQKECAESLYQPRHQRLLRIRIRQEIERAERSVFHVDRYWESPLEIVTEDTDSNHSGEGSPALHEDASPGTVEPAMVVMLGEGREKEGAGEDTKCIEKGE